MKYSLGFAFYFEIFRGYDPCTLCIYQRIPYLVVIGFGLVGMLKSEFATVCNGLAAVVFFLGALLAFYHVGVEQNWWVSVTGCESELAKKTLVVDLKRMLLDKPEKACDSIEWTVFGVSMAGYNAMFSASLAMICFLDFV